MDAQALAPIVGQTPGGATSQGALTDDPVDQAENGGGTDTSYSGVNGAALAALDERLKANSVAQAGIKGQQQAITAQRDLIGKQNTLDQNALQIAEQKHALEVQNIPSGALSMSAGQANTAIMPQGAGALPNSEAAGVPDYMKHTAGWDFKKHVTDQNFSAEDHATASAEMKKQTGHSAAEMYDALEK